MRTALSGKSECDTYGWHQFQNLKVRKMTKKRLVPRPPLNSQHFSMRFRTDKPVGECGVRFVATD